MPPSAASTATWTPNSSKTNQALRDDNNTAITNCCTAWPIWMHPRSAWSSGLRMAALPREAPGYGLVHGDVIPTNVLVGPDGALTLLDFDFCGPGWRAFDVATYLHVRSDERGGAASGPAFLSGYQEVRPLEDWERGGDPALRGGPRAVQARELGLALASGAPARCPRRRSSGISPGSTMP